MTLYSCLPSDTRFDRKRVLVPNGQPILFEVKLPVYTCEPVLTSLQYGKHDNSTLLSEYGFIIPENQADSLNVKEYVMEYFNSLPATVKRDKLEYLERRGHTKLVFFL